jgi:hypothetical protein
LLFIEGKGRVSDRENFKDLFIGFFIFHFYYMLFTFSFGCVVVRTNKFQF